MKPWLQALSPTAPAATSQSGLAALPALHHRIVFMPNDRVLLNCWRTAPRSILVSSTIAASAKARSQLHLFGLPHEELALARMIASARLPAPHPAFDAAMTLIAIAADTGEPTCRAVLLAHYSTACQAERAKDWLNPPRPPVPRWQSGPHNRFRRCRNRARAKILYP